MDIGLVTLDRTLGDRTGWMSFGYNNNNASFAAGSILNTAGYPAAGGYNGTQMEFSAGGINGLSSDGSAILYNQSSITTFGGQSGSAVWTYNLATGSRVVEGIHIAGSGTASSVNYATRITQNIFNDLQTWRNSDRVPGSATQARLQSADFGNVANAITSRFALAQDGEAGAEGDSGPAPIDSPRFCPDFDAVWSGDMSTLSTVSRAATTLINEAPPTGHGNLLDLAFFVGHTGATTDDSIVVGPTHQADSAHRNFEALDNLFEAFRREYGMAKDLGADSDTAKTRTPSDDTWNTDEMVPAFALVK